MTSLQCPSPSVAAMLARLGGGSLLLSSRGAGVGGGGGGSGVRPLAAALAAAASELDPIPPWSPTAARRALTELHASVMVADGALDDDEAASSGSRGGGGGGAGRGGGGGGGGASAAASTTGNSSSSSRAYDAGACRAWLAAAQAFVLAVQSLLLQCGAATATPDQAVRFASAAGDLRRAAAALATAGAPAVAGVSLVGAAAFASSAKGAAGGQFGLAGCVAPPGMTIRASAGGAGGSVVPISCFGGSAGGGGFGGGGGGGGVTVTDCRVEPPQPPQPHQPRSASGARLVAPGPARSYEWYARKPAL